MPACPRCGEVWISDFHSCATSPPTHVIEGPTITPLGPKSTKILEAIERLEAKLGRTERQIEVLVDAIEGLLENDNARAHAKAQDKP